MRVLPLRKKLHRGRYEILSNMSSVTLAQIVSSHGKSYIVECENQQRLIATARGKSTDFACGDWVEIQRLNQTQAVIENLQSRRTLLYRSDAYRSKLIAANVTQIVIVVAAKPSFSEDLIARSLIAAEENQIKSLIIFNKIDLPNANEARERLSFYQAQGYPIIALSAKKDISPLLPFLQNEVSVLVGQSGMGKSTILNTLLPTAQARTNEISSALDSGKHTTTHASLHCLNQTSIVIDSPGLQAFGLHHIPSEEIIRWMPDLRPYIGQCRFHNCRHQHEPDCALKLAATAGKISKERLALLVRLQEECQIKPY